LARAEADALKNVRASTEYMLALGKANSRNPTEAAAAKQKMAELEANALAPYRAVRGEQPSAPSASSSPAPLPSGFVPVR